MISSAMALLTPAFFRREVVVCLREWKERADALRRRV
jgi:hypothetical protein